VHRPGVGHSLVLAAAAGIDNLRVELFYTFDAKGTSKRATLFGSEDFKLGDYARVQLTYRF